MVPGAKEWVDVYNTGYEVFGNGAEATSFADETGLLQDVDDD